MKNKFAVAAVAGLAINGTAQAYEVIGKQLEVYGKAHVSLDQVDNDNFSNLSMSANSSRLGFRGETKLSEQVNGIFQVESRVSFDEGGDTLASRDSFAGLKGKFGTVKFGYIDTPFKNLGGDFDMFRDTAGDDRNILGVFPDSSWGTPEVTSPLETTIGRKVSNLGNIRARNSLVYQTPAWNGLMLTTLYSTQYQADADATTDQGADNNDRQLMSSSLTFKKDAFFAGLSYEDSSRNARTLIESDQRIQGARAVAKYSWESVTVGGIYETMAADGAIFGATAGDEFSRSAYGLNAALTLGDYVLKAQVLQADELENGVTLDDTDVIQAAAGVDYKLAKTTTLYGMVTQINNGDNAAFAIGGGGGHDGDVYSVVNPGDDLNIFSLGIVHGF